MAPARRYWLLKSEPGVFSIDDLWAAKSTSWEGVRNYQARNHLRDMRLGDLSLFYHSSAAPPGVAGVARVCREGYPDPTQFDARSPYHDAAARPADPRWWLVDVEFVEKLDRFVPLDELREDDALAGMLLTRRGMRLSVQPVSAAHFRHVLRLGKAGSVRR